MTLLNTSRELSERVEIDVQKRVRRFRTNTWWAAAWLCVAAIVWLAWLDRSGDYHVYEGGALATVHHMFENDCEKCHSRPWSGPIDRVMHADFSSHVYSVENSDCLKCHPGSKHYPTQHPEDQQPGCAACHHEHQGDVSLSQLSDSHCTDCHGKQLEVFDLDSGNYRASVDFPNVISSFQDHPEFAAVLLKEDSPVPGFSKEQKDERPTNHGAGELIKWGMRSENESSASQKIEAWIDRSEIRFNHKVHLKVHRDY